MKLTQKQILIGAGLVAAGIVYMKYRKDTDPKKFVNADGTNPYYSMSCAQLLALYNSLTIKINNARAQANPNSAEIDQYMSTRDLVYEALLHFDCPELASIMTGTGGLSSSGGATGGSTAGTATAGTGSTGATTGTSGSTITPAPHAGGIVYHGGAAGGVMGTGTQYGGSGYGTPVGSGSNTSLPPIRTGAGLPAPTGWMSGTTHVAGTPSSHGGFGHTGTWVGDVLGNLGSAIGSLFHHGTPHGGQVSGMGGTVTGVGGGSGTTGGAPTGTAGTATAGGFGSGGGGGTAATGSTSIAPPRRSFFSWLMGK